MEWGYIHYTYIQYHLNIGFPSQHPYVEETDRREGKSRRCCFGNVPTKYPFNSKDDLKKSFWKNIHFGSVVVWCGVNQMIIFFFWSIHSAKRLFFRSSWLGWSDFYFFIGQKTALNQRSRIILKVQIQFWARVGARAAKFSFSKIPGGLNINIFLWKLAWSFLLHKRTNAEKQIQNLSLKKCIYEFWNINLKTNISSYFSFV